MKNAAVNCGLVLLSMLVGAAILEVVLRFFVTLPSPYPFPPDAFRFDSRGYLSVVPGLSGTMDNRADFTGKRFSITVAGSREVPCAGPVPEGGARVFLIGDSQTFGQGLADGETWASVLQCDLAMTSPGGPTIINLGVPGVNVDQYWARFRAQVMPVLEAGDVVIVSATWNDLIDFYIGRDGLDAILQQAGLARAAPADPGDLGGLTEIDSDRVKRHPKDPTRRLSTDAATGQLLPGRAKTWRYAVYEATGIFVPVFSSLKGFAESLVFVSAVQHVLWPRLRAAYYRFRARETFFDKLPANVFESNFMVLAAIKRLADSRGARLIVQLLPNRLFFDDFYYRAYSKDGAVFPARDYIGHVSEPLCRRFGLRCVNRFNDLKTDVRDAHTFAYDGHYNERGAEKIGLALARDLESLFNAKE